MTFIPHRIKLIHWIKSIWHYRLNDSPHPHVPLIFGLLNTNSADKLFSTKSISVPSSDSWAFRSINIRTPSWTTSSSNLSVWGWEEISIITSNALWIQLCNTVDLENCEMSCCWCDDCARNHKNKNKTMYVSYLWFVHIPMCRKGHYSLAVLHLLWAQPVLE